MQAAILVAVMGFGPGPLPPIPPEVQMHPLAVNPDQPDTARDQPTSIVLVSSAAEQQRVRNLGIAYSGAGGVWIAECDAMLHGIAFTRRRMGNDPRTPW